MICSQNHPNRSRGNPARNPNHGRMVNAETQHRHGLLRHRERIVTAVPEPQ